MKKWYATIARAVAAMPAIDINSGVKNDPEAKECSGEDPTPSMAHHLQNS